MDRAFHWYLYLSFISFCFDSNNLAPYVHIPNFYWMQILKVNKDT